MKIYTVSFSIYEYDTHNNNGLLTFVYTSKESAVKQFLGTLMDYLCAEKFKDMAYELAVRLADDEYELNYEWLEEDNIHALIAEHDICKL